MKSGKWLDLSELCMRVLSHSSPVGLYVTLWTVAHQVPLSVGILFLINKNGVGEAWKFNETITNVPHKGDDSVNEGG